ncbi:MAG: GatB/YqeY domain-containing protein [Dethiobacteria bacterium]|nr:GatB/YqeY domain-containing protein [Bacillota bacterium]MDW7729178.1 GatB/YqeY domain-containing protein [Bacillota bacterium]
MSVQTLAEKLFEDQKEASKAKDRFRLTVIRMLRAELQNGAIAKKSPLDADEELAILTREVKRRQESLGDYERSGRQNLVDDLHKEIDILKKYLPEQLTEEELKQIVHEVITESGAETKREMGKVMSLLMPRIKGRADGALARNVVENTLK